MHGKLKIILVFKYRPFPFLRKKIILEKQKIPKRTSKVTEQARFVMLQAIDPLAPLQSLCYTVLLFLLQKKRFEEVNESGEKSLSRVAEKLKEHY